MSFSRPPKSRNRKKGSYHNNNNNSNSNKSTDDAKENSQTEDDRPVYTTSLSNKSGNSRTRRYYLPKETLQELKNDQLLLKSMKSELQHIHAKLIIDYNSGQAVVEMRSMDNERTLNILQHNVGIVITEAEFARLVEELISIERNRQELTSDPSQTISNVLSAISAGTSFVKHSQFGKPKTQWFSFDHDRLYWKDNENSDNHLNRSMEMKSIVRVRPGKTTKLLKSRKLNKISSDHCFSIIGVRKALDLQCKSRSERDEWFTYIEFAHRHWVRAKRKTMRLEDDDMTLDELILDVD